MTRWLAAALLLAASTAADAACTVSASGVAFGVYITTSTTPTDFTGTVQITFGKKSGDGSYRIALSRGGAASYATRRMIFGGFTLPYQLYTDAAHTRIWGDVSSGVFVVTGTDDIPKKGGTSTYQVYGRIAARQNARPGGGYLDTIVATLTY